MNVDFAAAFRADRSRSVSAAKLDQGHVLPNSGLAPKSSMVIGYDP